jgi:hypothetical protein
MTDDERLKKSAWRWPQLIAVLVIVVVLIGMILPVLQMSSHGMALIAQCGKNQYELYSASLTYAENEGYPWYVDQFPEKVTDAHSARVATAQLFGYLSRSLTIPPSLFSCPSSSFPKISKIDGTRPPITWAIEPGSAIYALDWSAPSDSGSSRVVMADRDPTAQKNKVMAVFGDAHSAALKIIATTPIRAGGILITEGADAKPVAVSVINKDATNALADHPELLPDDIYTNEGDSDNGSQPLVPAKGHPQRAWVK